MNYGMENSIFEPLLSLFSEVKDQVLEAYTHSSSERFGWANIEGTQESLSGVSDYALTNNSGWRLLGTAAEIKALNFFGNDLPSGGTVWTWKNDTWQVFTKGDTEESNQFNATYGTHLGNLRTIDPQQGFWVNTGANDSSSIFPIQVKAGGSHTCALLNNGSVKCWGHGNNGRLGDGNTVRQDNPITVSNITTAIQVTAGGSHTCALLSEGLVKCWGSGSYGQLGNGSTSDQTTPVTVSNITTAIQVTTGQDHTCVLLSDGKVQCWGRGEGGRLGNGLANFYSDPIDILGIAP